MHVSPDAQTNCDFWDRSSDEYQHDYVRKQLADAELYWAWPNYHEDAQVVLGDVTGKDILELGCGAAHARSGSTSRRVSSRTRSTSRNAQ